MFDTSTAATTIASNCVEYRGAHGTCMIYSPTDQVIFQVNIFHRRTRYSCSMALVVWQKQHSLSEQQQLECTWTLNTNKFSRAHQKCTFHHKIFSLDSSTSSFQKKRKSEIKFSWPSICRFLRSPCLIHKPVLCVCLCSVRTLCSLRSRSGDMVTSKYKSILRHPTSLRLPSRTFAIQKCVSHRMRWINAKPKDWTLFWIGDVCVSVWRLWKSSRLWSVWSIGMEN